VNSELMSVLAAAVTCSTACLKAASFTLEGGIKSTQFTNELQCRSSDLIIRSGRVEVVQRLDVSAHKYLHELDCCLTPESSRAAKRLRLE
jgi:hypothetical protein